MVAVTLLFAARIACPPPELTFNALLLLAPRLAMYAAGTEVLALTTSRAYPVFEGREAPPAAA
jgi:hypothetical protein